MKPVLRLLGLLLLTAGSLIAETGPGSPENTRFPAAFDSVDTAAQWARRQFAGGRVAEVAADSGKYLVVFLHGSGVPVVEIGLYRKKLFRWRFVKKVPPPSGSREFLHASAADGQIVLIGEKTGRTWPLAPAD
ncbi:MAG: hypothetical protein ACOZE5_02200 [Verrucomicrobiota bacterium]